MPSRPIPAAYHTRTWLLWAGVAAWAAGSTRNPLYLIVVLLAAQVVGEAEASRYTGTGVDSRRQGWGTFLRLGAIIALVSAGFNFLAAHVGSTVLLRLPAGWPLVGGPLTAEGLVYGLLNGLLVITLLAVFGTFNSGADPYALLRSIPAGFAQAGLITAIALAYVPQTLTRLGEIREAQLLRGHRVRGVRDLVPVAVPLLAGGLDRAIALAEAMEARGFTPAHAPPAGRVWARWTLAGGVLAVLVGGFLSLYFARQPYWGWGAMAGGAALVIGTLVRQGRQHRRSAYRHEAWHRRDTGVCVVLLLAAVGIGAIHFVAPRAWAYTPYLTLSWPPFQPALGLILLALATPALPLLADLFQSHEPAHD